MMRTNVLLFSCVMLFITQIHAGDWLTSFKMDETNDFIICGACAAHPNDPNGGFILVGFRDPGHRRFVIRIDKYGSIVWKKDLTILNIDNAGKFADWTDDQGYLIAGNHGIIKLKSNGDLAWSSYVKPYNKNLCYIKKIGNTGSKYIVIGDDLSSSYIFDDITKNGSNLILLPGYFYEVKPDGDYLIFSGENTSSTLCLYKTYASNLAPVTSFGTNGLKAYSGYKFGSAIDVSSTGYLIACENSSGKIQIVKTNKSGTIVSSSEWNYTPTMDIAYALPGRKKSLSIKKLNSGDVLLGGVYTNNSESDYFIQQVNSDGSFEIYKKQFANYGQDASL